MVFDINSTGLIGTILIAGTESLTGSIFITLLLIYLFLMGIAMLLQIPLEFVLIVLLPITIGLMAFYSSFIGVGLLFVIFIVFIIAKSLK